MLCRRRVVALLLTSLNAIYSVKIVQVIIHNLIILIHFDVQVSIPRTVEIGQENIILNCDYNFDAEEAQQLEIKWYFNKDPSPFFQWIAGLPDSRGSLNVNMSTFYL